MAPLTIDSVHEVQSSMLGSDPRTMCNIRLRRHLQELINVQGYNMTTELYLTNELYLTTVICHLCLPHICHLCLPQRCVSRPPCVALLTDLSAPVSHVAITM